MTKLCAHLNTTFPSLRLHVRFCHPPSPLRSQVDFNIDDVAGDTEGCELHYPSTGSPARARVWPDEKQGQVPGGECHSFGYGARRPSLHRKSLPLVSILKRRSAAGCEPLKNAAPSATVGNSFEISVMRYRTSCCGTSVSVEHIADWIDDIPSESDTDKHRCPTCVQACVLVRDRAYTQGVSHTHPSILPKYEHAFAFLLQYLTKLQSPPPQYPPISNTIGDKLPAYSLRDSDHSSGDKGYPWPGSHMHTGAVAPDRLYDSLEPTLLLSTELKEGFIRLTSIGGLTLVLFALLA